MNLKEAFRCPLTSVPLSLAFPDSALNWYNYLIDVRKTCRSTPLNEAYWIIDMSVVRTIKIKETYKEWFKTVIKFTLPSSSLKLSSIVEILVIKTRVRHEFPWKV